MNNYIDGFFRSLAMPSTADNMYEAGAALGRWIEEYNRHDWPKDSPDEGLNPPADTVLRKIGPQRTAGGQVRQDFSSMVNRGSSGSPSSPSGQRAPEGYEYVNRHQAESDRMLRELHDEVMNFMNSGPYPGVPAGKPPSHRVTAMPRTRSSTNRRPLKRARQENTGLFLKKHAVRREDGGKTQPAVYIG